MDEDRDIGFASEVEIEVGFVEGVEALLLPEFPEDIDALEPKASPLCDSNIISSEDTVLSECASKDESIAFNFSETRRRLTTGRLVLLELLPPETGKEDESSSLVPSAPLWENGNIASGWGTESEVAPSCRLS